MYPKESKGCNIFRKLLIAIVSKVKNCKQLKCPTDKELGKLWCVNMIDYNIAIRILMKWENFYTEKISTKS